MLLRFGYSALFCFCVMNICVMLFCVMPFCVMRFCFMPFCVMPLRYGYLRYASLRYTFLRYDYLRYAFCVMTLCVMLVSVMAICRIGLLPFRYGLRHSGFREFYFSSVCCHHEIYLHSRAVLTNINQKCNRWL